MLEKRSIVEKKKTTTNSQDATMQNRKGLHHTLYDDLCADKSKFFNYFIMSKPSFEELLSLIEDDIKQEDTNMRESIRPDERLAVTLR